MIGNGGPGSAGGSISEAALRGAGGSISVAAFAGSGYNESLSSGPGFRSVGGGPAILDNPYRVYNMADTPKVHPQADTASVDEAKLLHDIVHERVRLPQDVRRVEFRLGEDSTGAPAVWIVFVAHDDLDPSKSKIASLQRVAEEVRSIVRSETSRWPYIEIATE